MRRSMKYIALALLALMLAALLSACSEESPKHPLVAKWVQDYDEGNTRVMFSFEAIGDAEVCVWRFDEEAGGLAQSEYYIGSYEVDEGDSSVTLALEIEERPVSIAFAYEISEDELRLSNDEYDLTLVRAAENSGKTK